MQIVAGKIQSCCKNPPIKFEVADCFIYNYIAKFMGTKKSILTVNKHIAETFFIDGATDVLTRNEGGADLEATLDVAVRLGDITYNAIQSAN